MKIVEIHIFSFKKMHLKMSSLCCPVLNVLGCETSIKHNTFRAVYFSQNAAISAGVGFEMFQQLSDDCEMFITITPADTLTFGPILCRVYTEAQRLRLYIFYYIVLPTEVCWRISLSFIIIGSGDGKPTVWRQAIAKPMSIYTKLNH